MATYLRGESIANALTLLQVNIPTVEGSCIPSSGNGSDKAVKPIELLVGNSLYVFRCYYCFGPDSRGN